MVCRDAGGRETVLQSAVGPGVDDKVVATALCQQCSVPFISEGDPDH